MKKLFFLIIPMFLSFHLSAQVWFSLETGVRPEDSDGIVTVNTLSVDTINDLLYVGGLFYYAGDSVSRNLAIWDGNKWLSTEDDGEFAANEVTASIMMHDTLLLASGKGLKRYVNHHFIQDVPTVGDIVNAFCVYHDTLYAGEESGAGISKWNGQYWQAVGGGINGPIPGEVNALGIYQDQLIIGGLFKSVGDSSFNNIAAWNGSSWDDLNGGTKYSKSQYDGNVFSIGLYNSNLVISGNFDTAGGVYCQMFAEWNGKNWAPMNDEEICGVAYDLKSKDSLLYAAGDMYKGTSCFVNREATWDGNNWHDLNFTDGGIAFSQAFFKHQLYVGGIIDFYSTDGEEIKGIGRLNYATNVNTVRKLIEVKINPNPSTNYFNLNYNINQASLLYIIDQYGRTIKTCTLSPASKDLKIDVHDLAQGLYLITLQNSNERFSEKMVIQR
ncbi:MAG: T9SS type A sorting domain-containing protein [Chitinophagales bacterium]|nr:T9SS type A sorting domain-containing protein [Chitinophagales bacterium]